MTKPHANKLRHGRFSQPHGIYLITTVTQDRKTVFNDLKAARTLIHTLHDAQNLGHADTLAFVVMPDHLHWLMQLGERLSLSRVVGSVKSNTARQLGLSKLWQAGFHDHAVRKEEDLADLARYIVMNPVRAGIVNKIDQYSHWDAIWL